MVRAFKPALGSLLVWASLACAQRPSEADAAAMIEKTRDKALAYAHSLPDFMCTEVIRRYHQSVPANGGHARGAQLPLDAKWVVTDKLTVKLSFFQQREEHK